MGDDGDCGRPFGHAELVPGQPEVGGVDDDIVCQGDSGGGGVGGTGGEREWPGHADDGQLAGNVGGAVVGRAGAAGREDDRAVPGGIEEVRGAQVLVALGVAGVDGGRPDGQSAGCCPVGQNHTFTAGLGEGPLDGD